ALDFGVDAEGGNSAFFLCDEVVHANDDLFFLLDGALEFVGGLLDLSLDEATLDGPQNSAQGIDFFDVGGGAFFDFVGEMLDGVGAGHGVDGVGDACFMGDDLLGAQGDERGVLGGKREGFIEGVCVQRLAAAEYGGERLNGDADDVVFRLLRG